MLDRNVLFFFLFNRILYVINLRPLQHVRAIKCIAIYFEISTQLPLLDHPLFCALNTSVSGVGELNTLSLIYPHSQRKNP